MAITVCVDGDYSFERYNKEAALEVLKKIYRIEIPESVFELLDCQPLSVGAFRVGYTIKNNNHCLLVCRESGIYSEKYSVYLLGNTFQDGLCLTEWKYPNKIRICHVEDGLLDKIKSEEDELALKKAFKKNILALKEKHIQYFKNKMKTAFKKEKYYQKYKQFANKCMEIDYDYKGNKELVRIVKCREIYRHYKKENRIVKIKFLNFALNISTLTLNKFTDNTPLILLDTIKKHPNHIHTLKYSLYTGTQTIFYTVKLFMRKERLHALFYDGKSARLYKIRSGSELNFLSDLLQDFRHINFNSRDVIPVKFQKKTAEIEIPKVKEETLNRILPVYIPFKKESVKINLNIIKRSERKNTEYYLELGDKKVKINGNHLPKCYKDTIPLEKLVEEIKEKERNAEDILEYIYNTILLKII